MYTFRKYETIIVNGFMCLYLIKGLNFYGCLLFLMATYFTRNLYLDFMNCFILCKINTSQFYGSNAPYSFISYNL